MTRSAYADGEGRYKNFDDIKKANKAIGHGWFDPSLTAAHGTKVVGDLVAGRYWVESSYRDFEAKTGTKYQPVVINPEGAIQYLHGGETFESADAAHKIISGAIS